MLSEMKLGNWHRPSPNLVGSFPVGPPCSACSAELSPVWPGESWLLCSFAVVSSAAAGFAEPLLLVAATIPWSSSTALSSILVSRSGPSGDEVDGEPPDEDAIMRDGIKAAADDPAPGTQCLMTLLTIPAIMLSIVQCSEIRHLVNPCSLSHQRRQSKSSDKAAIVYTWCFLQDRFVSLLVLCCLNFV